MATYTIQHELGHGAFGRVVCAKSDSGGLFAIKTFDPSDALLSAIAAGYVSLAELKRRFASEAIYQAKILHPNIVRVFDSNMQVEPPFFVMELAQASLAQDLEKDHTLGGTPHQALFDILAGLEGIHSQGIYHRDLKPQNILRMPNADGSMRYALSDFGLIKVTTSDSTTLTATGAHGGTERYAAPELIQNFKRATARSDIFSFGVILFDIFMGRIPRVPYTEIQFGGAVGAVAAKCTKTVPARRYSSIAELRTALYEALRTEAPKFASRLEEQIVEMLKSDRPLSEQEWDRVFLLMEEVDISSRSMDLLLRAFSKQHLLALHQDAPDLLMAFSGYYTDYVEQGRGAFDFDYCDVVADKLTWLFELGDVATKANVLLALLGLGTSHNRWFVERRFLELAGPSLDPAVAERLILEVDVRGLNLRGQIEHLERSIGVSRERLSPMLNALWN